jgi:serine protease
MSTLRLPARAAACLTALAALLIAAPGASAAAGTQVPANAVAGRDYKPGEVVVRYARDAGPSARAAVQRGTHVGSPKVFAPYTRVMKIRDGRSVPEAIAALRRRSDVVSASPNWIARTSFVPNDPGRLSAPGGWASLQWNLGAEAGINAPAAWDNLIAGGRAGGAGVVVAVLDTGVAYSNRGRFRRSPDLSSKRFVKGYDFADEDPWPNDENGHGTHVASTIAETANNGIGAVGVAYGARIMPVRVLDRLGEGDTAAISSGIRYAAKHGAQVINLSFEFGTVVTRAEIPDILSALRYAHSRGALVVGAAGNGAEEAIAYPAKSSDVLSVGATTEHLCLADYSNSGSGLDLVAPGGGPDADFPDDPDCQPSARRGRDVYQMTFTSSVHDFGLPGGYRGTSMAAPHVSGVAALVIASGVLGPDPSPRAVEARLKATARDLGAPGYDTRYGAGLVNAAAATAKSPGT